MDLSTMDRFTEYDRQLLRLVGEPDLERALASGALVDLIFDPRSSIESVPSPALVFAAFVHRVAAELEGSAYVSTWTSPRVRLPTFDVSPLREFLADRRRRWFLIDLLVSFASARPSGLDPYRLAAGAAAMPEVAQASMLRQLGDLALFLTGVLPDHTGSTRPAPSVLEAAARSARLPDLEILRLLQQEPESMAVMETLGERWYRLAVEYSIQSRRPLPPVIGEVAGRFGAGRRVLNLVADRFLYRFEPPWAAA
jgi:hypothetical protein